MTIQTLVTKSNHNINDNLSTQNSPTKYRGFHVQCQLFLVDLNQNQNALKMLVKIVYNFMKSWLVGVELFPVESQPDKQTDMMRLVSHGLCA